jgi:predicted DCC family thiol-disulfide oxidoreductase YuxK
MMRTAGTATLVYDGDCGFCTWVALRGERLLPASVTAVPWQQADLPALGLSVAAVERAVQWVSPGEPPAAGHRAIARWLMASGLPWSLAGRIMLMWPVSWLAAGVYRLVAANRHRIPGPWRRDGVTCGVTREEGGRRG